MSIVDNNFQATIEDPIKPFKYSIMENNFQATIMEKSSSRLRLLPSFFASGLTWSCAPHHAPE